MPDVEILSEARVSGSIKLSIITTFSHCWLLAQSNSIETALHVHHLISFPPLLWELLPHTSRNGIVGYYYFFVVSGFRDDFGMIASVFRWHWAREGISVNPKKKGNPNNGQWLSVLSGSSFSFRKIKTRNSALLIHHRMSSVRTRSQWLLLHVPSNRSWPSAIAMSTTTELYRILNQNACIALHLTPCHESCKEVPAC